MMTPHINSCRAMVLATCVLVFLGGRIAAQPESLASDTATTIQSDSLEMRGTAEQNFFTFTNDVHVVGENIEITCDQLEIVSARHGDPGATIGRIGAIERIVAVGNVRILQAGREALAGRAVMDPLAGSVVLSENPRILDRGTEVSGWRIVLSRDKSIRVLQDPSASTTRQRASVILGGELPDFSFNRDEPPEQSEEDDWIGDDPLDEMLRNKDANADGEGSSGGPNR